jgi:hypothetical protein
MAVLGQAPLATKQVVTVVFEAADGARWRAVGGGHTLQDAVAFARASTPEPYSHIVAIDDPYGD